MDTNDNTLIELTEACSFKGGFEHPGFNYCYTENFLIGFFKRSSENFLHPCKHSHNAYEFIIPLSPITNLVAENSVYIGEPNCVYPVQSGRMHGIKYSQNNVSYISIVVEKLFFEAEIKRFAPDGVEFNSTIPYSDSLHDYVKIFRREWNNRKTNSEYILNHLRDLICAELIRSATEDNIDIRKKSAGYAPGISLVMKYINENYDSDISVEELAKICGFSKPYFASTFKEIFGTTPKAYVNTLRIAKAKNLLEFTDTPLKTIAVSSGFKSLNTFFCAFKKSTDMTPSEYRNLRKEDII